MTLKIHPYSPEYIDQFFAMLEREGDEWADYWRGI